MKFVMKVELEVADGLLDKDDNEEMDWLYHTVFSSDHLFLHENKEWCDTIGQVRILTVKAV